MPTGIALSLTGESYFLSGVAEGGAVEQLVLPHSLRERVLTLGWTSGQCKNTKSIANIFYWPGLYTDVDPVLNVS